MTELNGQLGELKMTLQITRKDTGRVDEVDMTSAITDPETHEKLLKELGDERHTFDSK